jgi:hypothetical protein
LSGPASPQKDTISAGATPTVIYVVHPKQRRSLSNAANLWGLNRGAISRLLQRKPMLMLNRGPCNGPERVN